MPHDKETAPVSPAADTPSTSTPPEAKSPLDWIACAGRETRRTFLDALADGPLLALPYLFEFWAMDHQLPPGGDWRAWLVLGGRGAGKTRAGAEWVRAQVEGPRPLDPGRARHVALVGETYDQARDVMVLGESGIVACSPPDRRPEWQVSKRRLVWPNGAAAQLYSASDPEALRGPQFDAAWADEFGCAAVDKGTNQPNRFLDPKSSESGLPHFSDGRRDEVVQANYYRATLAHWSDPAANPVSDIYGGPMIDLSRCFAWSWDARPWPWFPAAQDVWADGVNYARGHWLNGRASGRGLGSVIGEICDRAGLHDYDVDAAHGHVRGYLVPDAGTARAALQPLLLRHGIDAVERDGRLRFQPRDRARPLELDPDRLAVIESLEGRLEETRAAEAEQAGRVRLRFVAHGSDFEIAAAEAVLPDDATHAVSESEMPLAMTRAEATSTAERWLAEARVARDTCRFALPPSRFALGPGDVVRLGDGGGGALWRIDRTEQGAALLVEAVRVEPSVYLPAAFEPEAPSRLAPFVVPVPVESVFLDLPLMTGDEAPHAPHLALRADPWPGTVAVWDAPFDAGYALNSVLAVRAAMGVTETALPAAPPGRIDRGPALAVRLDGGALGDVTEEALLAGANLVAIGDGSPARWELFQFRAARMLGPDRWLLSERLRGQAGSDGVMPPSWPAGSRIVLMNGAAQQIALPPTARNVARHYRIGPARRGYDDPSYTHVVAAFAGEGLRPYRPCHLRARAEAGAWHFRWVRRTRIDGDGWEAAEVPLGEERERYLVRIVTGTGVQREVTVDAPEWVYAAADMAADGVAAPFELRVAQVSARYGPGPFAALTVGG